MMIEDSLREILERSGERFADAFYRKLFEDFPDLRDFFEGVDLRQQAAMLTMALQVAVQHHCRPTRSTKDYLQVLGQRHHQRGVTKDNYPGFQDTLLVSLAEFHGKDWTQTLADEWRAAFDDALTVMHQAYPVGEQGPI